jgi:protein transport protein SEC24
MDYVFAFDVSDQAIQSGFVRDACTSLLEMLYGRTLEDGTMLEPYFPTASKICIITFNSSLHFYDLSVRTVRSHLELPRFNERLVRSGADACGC